MYDYCHFLNGGIIVNHCKQYIMIGLLAATSLMSADQEPVIEIGAPVLEAMTTQNVATWSEWLCSQAKDGFSLSARLAGSATQWATSVSQSAKATIKEAMSNACDNTYLEQVRTCIQKYPALAAGAVGAGGYYAGKSFIKARRITKLGIAGLVCGLVAGAKAASVTIPDLSSISPSLALACGAGFFGATLFDGLTTHNTKKVARSNQ